MKKIFTLILLLVLAATIKTSAQATGDIAAVLQKCVDLPDIQQFYTKDGDGNHSIVYVLQHGVSFPVNTDVVKFGEKVRFIEKDQLSSQAVDSYFLFWELTIEADSAKADYIYNYPGSDNLPTTVHVVLKMQKEGGVWNITNTTI
jgi:hypothetical protein